MKNLWMQDYISSTRAMECHLCGKEFIKCENSFRTHMRMHIRKKEITKKDELMLRMAIFNKDT